MKENLTDADTSCVEKDDEMMMVNNELDARKEHDLEKDTCEILFLYLVVNEYRDRDRCESYEDEDSIESGSKEISNEAFFPRSDVEMYCRYFIVL